LSAHINQERIDKSAKETLKNISSYKTDFEDRQKEYRNNENDLNRFLTEAKNNDK
jgi:flagellar capping protein FliD